MHRLLYEYGNMMVNSTDPNAYVKRTCVMTSRQGDAYTQGVSHPCKPPFSSAHVKGGNRLDAYINGLNLHSVLYIISFLYYLFFFFLPRAIRNTLTASPRLSPRGSCWTCFCKGSLMRPLSYTYSLQGKQ